MRRWSLHVTEGARSFQTTSGSLELLTLQTHKICEVTIYVKCRASDKPWYLFMSFHGNSWKELGCLMMKIHRLSMWVPHLLSSASCEPFQTSLWDYRVKLSTIPGRNCYSPRMRKLRHREAGHLPKVSRKANSQRLGHWAPRHFLSLQGDRPQGHSSPTSCTAQGSFPESWGGIIPGEWFLPLALNLNWSQPSDWPVFFFMMVWKYTPVAILYFLFSTIFNKVHEIFESWI